MSINHVKYLLIGGGIASSSAAGAIREWDRHGSILLVGQEIVRPYYRPSLSKRYLRRQANRDQLFTQDHDWFERNHVELRTGRRAAHLDVGRGTVTLDRGEVIAYDQLLLATGMAPLPLDIPGVHLPNLFYLRTLEDVHLLHKAMDKARLEGCPHLAGSRTGPRGKAVVIGAGLLGVELAGSLTQAGISVDLLAAQAHPWDKFAGEIAGKALTAFLENRGVRVHPNTRPLRLEGDGRVQRIAVSDGSWIECDFAVATIGAVTHRELLRGTPIAAEKAILADSYCRTNVPNVYAAGDCAAIYDRLFSRHRILDHWEHAALTGALAGKNMAGIVEAYCSVNSFSSEVFELSLQVWGEARIVDHRIVRSARTTQGGLPEIIEIGLASDGRVAQVLVMGQGDDHELLRNLVGRRARVDGLEEKLKDPEVPLRDFIR